MRKLNSEQFNGLMAAFLSAFSSPQSLEIMLRLRLNENIHQITRGGNLRLMVFDLIQWAETAGRIEQLVEGARAEVPGNPDLQQWVTNLSNDPQSSEMGKDVPDNRMFTSAFVLQLAEILTKSGRIGTRSGREVICYTIGIDPDDLPFMDASTRDYAVLLVRRLSDTENFVALRRLCDIVEWNSN